MSEIKINNKLENQLFKISRFKEVIKRTKPHKHDGYFEIIYLSQGAGFHWIDTEKFQITPPVVYILTEGQLHYWEMTDIPKGYVLLFKEEFFDNLLESKVLDLVDSLKDAVDIPLPEDANLDVILHEMEGEYNNPAKYAHELMLGYLQVVLSKLNIYREQSGAHILNGKLYFKKFQQMLRSSHPIINLKVSELSDRLNISPQNLNAICRKASGRSASELINEQVALEVKRYLLHSDNTIGEIALALKFSDSSHLIKYFKRITGETPQSFRNRHFSIIP